MCNAVGELAEMLEPHSGVHVHRGACWEAWIEATESQRMEWVLSLFRQQLPPGRLPDPPLLAAPRSTSEATLDGQRAQARVS